MIFTCVCDITSQTKIILRYNFLHCYVGIIPAGCSLFLHYENKGGCMLILQSGKIKYADYNTPGEIFCLLVLKQSRHDAGSGQ